MSLLMQALKKAEKSKQKQNDAALVKGQDELAQAQQAAAQKTVNVPAAAAPKEMSLSLNNDDNNDAQELGNSVSNNKVGAATNKPSMMELSLTPHDDDPVENKSAENVSTEDALAEKALLDTNGQQTEPVTVDHFVPLDNNVEPHTQRIEPAILQQTTQEAEAFIVPVSAALTTPIASTTSTTSTTSTNHTENINNVASATQKNVRPDHSDKLIQSEIKKDELEELTKQITNPKIDIEKKQWAAQANQNNLLDQEKAKAVFSSKTSTRTLRFKWLIIVAIAVVVALIGFAYMVWQKTSENQNQFPVAPPLAASDIILPAQEPISANETATEIVTNTESMSSAAELANTTNSTNSANAANAAKVENVEKIKNIGDAKTAQVEPSNKVIDQAVKAVKASTLKNQQELSLKTTKIDQLAKANQATSAQNKVAIQENDLTNTNTNTQFNTNAGTKKASKKSSVNAFNDPNAIEIRKGDSSVKVNPNLVSAYQAYIAGDRQLAVTEYQKVVLQEPNNRDALLGLAAIALSQRQAEQAGEYYGRLLNLDPNDADAIAGLTSLQQGDPVQSESRLKAALNQNPNSGAILFALGNLYAQQSRWSDAQQTYFRAYTNTPTSADYAFNLAISLDRLNQRKLAIEYYQRALNLAKSGPGNFNANKVQQRLQQLNSAQDN